MKFNYMELDLGDINNEQLDEITNVSIDKLKLNLRVRNCLLAEKICTVRDILECRQEDIDGIKNMGRNPNRLIGDALKLYCLDYIRRQEKDE